MDKPSQEALAAAAKWWAEQLAAPRFDNLGPTRGRNAEETRTNDMASMLASMNAASTTATEERLAAFQEALLEAVNEADFFPGSLYVDYSPDLLLERPQGRPESTARAFPGSLERGSTTAR